MSAPDPELRSENPFEISVVVCVKNGARTIGRQLRALGTQVDAPPYEIVVVDNGSTDDTSSVVRDWCETGIGSASQVSIIDASAKPGIPFARNMGAAAARGRIIAYCDADDEAASNWVSIMAREATQDMVQGCLVPVHPDGSIDPKTAGRQLRMTSYLPFATTGNFAMPRASLLELGGFDESLPPYGGEDLELSWRGQEQGLLLRFVEESVVHFTITSGRRAIRKEMLIAKAHVAIAVRHPQGRRALHSTSLNGALKDLTLLPIRLLGRSGMSRPRAVKLGFQALGTLSGFWTYVMLRKRAQLPLRKFASEKHSEAS